MSVSKDSLRCDVLHIRPEWAEQAAEIDSVLEADALTVEICPDVYRGLARVCAADSSQSPSDSDLRAIVVCVDDLGPAELEFFSIVSRLRRTLPVFVYGQERYNFRVAKAIELGASGHVTAAAIHSVAGSREPPRPESGLADDRTTQATTGTTREASGIQPPPPPPTKSLADSIEPEPQALPVEPDEGAAVVPEAETTQEQPARTRARVPWQRYADRPTRIGPQRTPPSPPTPSVETPKPGEDPALETSPAPSSAPLLTEAELQALLGDDISAIAPEPHSEPGSPDVREEEGLA